jgi:glutamate/tyrosine decarboxylase-like PLP-dependent enzyme
MVPQALQAAIDADLAAGHLPIMINATAGTTVLGCFDPLEPIADIAEAHGLWLHVDGAYGGSMLFHEELKQELRGIDRADSVTWDPHKMMGVPLVCSVFLCRHPGLMTASFNEIATYLFQDDSDELNPGTRSLQCGRRNDALKLWTAWKTHGDAGYVERLTTLRDLALYARDLVAADPGLRLVREPESLNVCFAASGVDAIKLCTELNREGRAMVSHADVDGEPVVRLVFLDPTNRRAEVDVFFEQVRIVAEKLRREAA